MAPYYQPVLDAIKAQPHDWLVTLLEYCEAVEAEDRGRIMLLTGPLVAGQNPKFPPIEDLPAKVFYETMARLLFMGEHPDFRLLLEWYRSSMSFARAASDHVTETWTGIFEFVAMPGPKLSEKELERQLGRNNTALREVLDAHASAVALAGPPVYDPGGPIPGEFGTATWRPSRVSVLKAGIGKLIWALMGVYQQLFDAALDHLGSGASDRGAKLLALRARWIQAMSRTLGDARFNKSPQLSRLPIDLAKIRYGKPPHHWYQDAFLPHAAREFAFTPYDRDSQDEPNGKTAWLVDLVRYRSNQLHFYLDQFGELYPADGPPPGTPSARRAAEARRKRFAARRTLIDQVVKRGGRLNLQSEDDLVSFGCAYFTTLLDSYGAQPTPDDRREAWDGVVRFLGEYLRTQTVHTEFNLDEKTYYFDRQFPRAINGGVLHDCGVYAVRMAYVFLSLGHCIRTAESEVRPPRVSFILLPVHVGLIVEVEAFPPIIVHNDMLFRLSADQEVLWRKEWDSKPEKGHPDPQNPALRDWKFREDGAAQMYLSETDLPIRRDPITPVSAPPKKREIWSAFQRLVVAGIGGLFSGHIENPGRREYQFDVRFLTMLTLEKRWHDANVVPFWNEGCFPLWNGLHPSRDPEVIRDLLQRNAPARTRYEDELKKLIKKVEDTYGAEIRPAKVELSKEFRSLPDALGRHAQRITVGSRLEQSAAGIGAVGEVREHLADLAAGNVKVPRFASEANLLARFGE